MEKNMENEMETGFEGLGFRVWEVQLSCALPTLPGQTPTRIGGKALICHIVILVRDQASVSVGEIRQCLVHLLTVVEVLGFLWVGVCNGGFLRLSESFDLTVGT